MLTSTQSGSFAPVATYPKRGMRAGGEFSGVTDGRYEVRLASNQHEIRSALGLRHEVFNVELGGQQNEPGEGQIEFDLYDLQCRHLIVRLLETGETVGTYRLNSIETAGSAQGFYSSGEFTIENLPPSVIRNGVEIGRACIAQQHRNTKVLFLLWKALLRYLEHTGKRYFFGCCSIFSTDEAVGRAAYQQLFTGGYLHPEFSVSPCRNAVSLGGEDVETNAELPALFNMYLRIGAKVCGPPMLDRDFGTIDMFVVFDVKDLNEKYRRMFA